MAETIQRSFTAGEISPSLQSRADLSKYTNGLSLCENFIVRSQGGVYSRPGMRFIGEVDDSTKRARLIPFQFNTEQTYILVFEHLKMSVIRDGAFVLDGASRFELVTPYTEAQLSRIGFTQSADVMTLVHHNHDPANLSRLDHDNWTLTEISYAPTVTPPVFYAGATVKNIVNTVKNITDVTQDNPAKVDASSHTFINGDVVSIAGIAGMIELNGRDFTVTDATSNTFKLLGEDSTLHTPYVSGGNATRHDGITQSNPAKVKAIGHTFIEGNLITITGVVGMTELNGREFTATNVTSDTFELLGENSTGHTAYVSGGTATRQNGVTVTGSGAGSYDKTYTYVITAVDVNGVESLTSVSSSITTKSLTTTAGARVQWNVVPGASYYRIYKDPSTNTALFGWIGDSKNEKFDDFNVAPLTSDSPPVDRQPFADADANPSVVTYYQQRQIFANTLAEPQTVFTTQTNNFQSLRVSSPSKSDDGVTFTVSSQQVNEIRHLISLDALVLLTSGGEFRMTEGRDQVLTPSTIGVRPQSYNGASHVQPVIIDSTAVYVQEKGSKLRDLNFNGDVYAGNDLSIMSEHLFKDHTILEMTYADEPYGVIWCVRDDGVLLGLTYQREHQVWAWHKHTTDGTYESIATITEDGRDAVYATVKRIINGFDRRYVERIEPRFDDESANVFAVDSGLSYNGAPATTFAGLDHLEGKTVVILADGIVVKNKIVSGGSVTLSRAASKVHIGLSYTPVIETLDIDAQSMFETLKAKQISVSKVTIETLDSRGGWVGGILDDGSYEMVEIKPRYESDAYDPIQLKSFKDEVDILPGWPQGGKIRIEQRDPLPLTITSIIPELDISG